MFSVFGPTGRVFQGTLEQMRQIRQVHASDRTRSIEPTVRDGSDSALREAVEFGSPIGTPVQRSAIAAYAATQHPVSHGWYDIAVADAMSRSVLTLPIDSTVHQAWQQLDHHGRGQAPVVSADGILVGLATRSEMANFAHWPKPGAPLQAWEDWRNQGIETVMVTPVPSVAPTADLRRAASALLDCGLPGLPVVDDDGRVIGFVSRTDVLRAALRDAGLDVWG